MTLWETPGHGCGRRPVSVDDRDRPDRALRPVVDAGDALWTAAPGVTSGNGMSSTIHTPYYRDCQNSIL
jgi:hypothetical protein